MHSDPSFEAWLLDELRGRAPKSASPEELARLASGAAPDEWRSVLPKLRQTAVRLAHQGLVDILRKGKAVDPDHFKGVFRLRYRQS